MKKVISFILVLAFAFSLCACNSVDKKAIDTQLQGVWSRSYDSNGTYCYQICSFYEGNATYIFEGGNSREVEGTYKIRNDKIICNWTDGSEDTFYYEYEDGEFSLFDRGYAYGYRPKYEKFTG